MRELRGRTVNLAERIDAMRAEEAARFEAVNARFDGVFEQLRAINERLDAQGERMGVQAERMDGLTERMDGLVERMDGLAGRMDGLSSEVRSTVVEELGRFRMEQASLAIDRRSLAIAVVTAIATMAAVAVGALGF